MKKILFCIITLCLIASSILQMVYADSNYTQQILNKNAYYNQFTTFEYNDLPTLKIENSFLDYPETINVIKEHYEFMLRGIPNDIVSKLKETDVIIYCVSDCMDYWVTKKSVQALGFYGGDYIYLTVSFDPEDAKINMNNVLYHEVGHAAGYLFGRVDQTDECEKAYQLDSKLREKHYKNSRMEMFAEVFDLLMLGFSDESNHMIRANAFRDYPNMATYICKSYNLPHNYEEFYYWGIRASVYGILKEYRKAQKMFN